MNILLLPFVIFAILGVLVVVDDLLGWLQQRNDHE